MENIFTKYIIPLIVLLAILLSATSIGNFFDISINKYLGYIMWFIGLTIMFFILPKQRPTRFELKDT